jgi:formylglycine-generating enzyme required for sulfatase activity
MNGNINEWCRDWYGEDYYKASPEMDPQGPTSGLLRVLRGGGSGDSDSAYCRSALRFWDSPEDEYAVLYMGFRVAVSFR